MIIRTSKGTEHEVRWIDCPIQSDELLVMQLDDPRGLPQVAASLDGLSEINRRDEQQGDRDYLGYTRMIEIRRMLDGSYRVTLQRDAT